MTSTTKQRMPALPYLLLSGFIALAMSMALMREANVRANFFDLGQYVSFVSSIWREGAYELAFSTHAQPFLLLLSPAGAMGNPSTLLIIAQALMTGLGGWIFLRALPEDNRLLGSLLFSATLAAWFAMLNDFHLEHLLFPLYLGFIALLAGSGRRSSVGLVLLAIGICAVKEPYALTSVGAGLLAFWAGKRRAGLIIIALSATYFWLATEHVIPAFTQGRSIGEIWLTSFGHLGGSPLEMLLSIVKDPVGTLWPLVTARKLLFVGVLVVPFVYALRYAPVAIVPALPTFGIMFVSSDANHAYLGHHYTVAVSVALLGAVVLAVPRIPDTETRKRALSIAVLASVASLVLFGPAPVSRLFWSQHASGINWKAYVPDARSRVVRALVDQHIPLDRDIAVSVQNTLHFDRIAARPLVFAFPGGVQGPEIVLPRTAGRVLPAGVAATTGLVTAQYVVVDARRPMSLGSGICLWDPIQICADPAFRDRYAKAISQLRSSFELIGSHDGFEIYRRQLP